MLFYNRFDANSTSVGLAEPREAIDGSSVYQALLMTMIMVTEEEVGLGVELKPVDPSGCLQYLIVLG
ncbi:unnamed protein product [Protopolystoma xenopodis]|uniref:Uncharacterized protein n=1 Tax=Protopolystoma xenopodis TaxID=117903 RepID=A0A3S5C8F8_9PLAT|nr:unnamed protein product [Protopolystoma xenopodis]